jgi:hypothetical protein
MTRNTSQSTFQNDYITLLKRTIETKQVFSPRLIVHLTFTGHKIVNIGGFPRRVAVSSPTPDEAQAKFLSWTFYNSKKYNTHILPWAVLDDEKKHRVHIHAILSAEQELPVSIIDFWKKNYGIRSSAKIYDPDLAGVRYIYDHHDPMKLGFHSVVCPKRKSACRRSKCIYRRRGTNKTDYRK